MKARALCQATLGFVVLAVSGPAKAATEAPVLQLSWQAPPECGTAEKVELRVRQLLAHPPTLPLPASVRVTRSAEQYRAELTTSDGRRELAAPQCSSLTEALAVVLALAIDPEAKDRKEVAQARPSGDANGSPSWSVGVGSAWDTAALPHPAFGGMARATLTSPAWSASLRATYWLPERGASPSSARRGGRFFWWTAAPTGCGAWRAGQGRVELCLGAELGRLTGEAFGVSAGKAGSLPWLAVVAGPELAWPLRTRVFLRVGLGAALALLGNRPFVLENPSSVEEIHRPGTWSARAQFGLDVVF